MNSLTIKTYFKRQLQGKQFSPEDKEKEIRWRIASKYIIWSVKL